MEALSPASKACSGGVAWSDISRGMGRPPTMRNRCAHSGGAGNTRWAPPRPGGYPVTTAVISRQQVEDFSARPLLDAWRLDDWLLFDDDAVRGAVQRRD